MEEGAFQFSFMGGVDCATGKGEIPVESLDEVVQNLMKMYGGDTFFSENSDHPSLKMESRLRKYPLIASSGQIPLYL